MGAAPPAQLTRLAEDSPAAASSSGTPPGTAYRKLPPAVRQHDSYMCWAAATESWLKAVVGGSPPTQDDLAGMYSSGPNGRLEPTDFPKVASGEGMAYKVILAKNLDTSFIADKLRKKGHVLLIYNLPSGKVSHANVVYGVGYPEGKDLKISVMDPETATYVNRPSSFYANAPGGLIIAWPM